MLQNLFKLKRATDFCVYLGHPLLREKCQPIVWEKDEELVSILVSKMKAILQLPKRSLISWRRSSNSSDVPIGISANQLGHAKRMFAVHIPRELVLRDSGGEPLPFSVFVNPRMKIVNSAKFTSRESCVSVPCVDGDVWRYSNVIIEAENEKRQPVSINCRGLLSAVMQHEMDHLKGEVFLDHLQSTKTLRYSPPIK
ncbi:peptide deformylase-like [Symsagittifera roscoffensis]|uniref:peptide deformylase-like n=1 Tax=Symsagittifera roscoffensis TaxID=84072 RepID=UPI00307B2E13